MRRRRRWLRCGGRCSRYGHWSYRLERGREGWEGERERGKGRRQEGGGRDGGEREGVSERGERER